jgi:hypothetical protein
LLLLQIHGNGDTDVRRVGGSLMVTRALGDAYLKSVEFTTPTFKVRRVVSQQRWWCCCAHVCRDHFAFASIVQHGVPYITAVPLVHVFDISQCEPLVLVLASDGVWEKSGNDAVVAAALNLDDARAVGVGNAVEDLGGGPDATLNTERVIGIPAEHTPAPVAAAAASRQGGALGASATRCLAYPVTSRSRYVLIGAVVFVGQTGGAL